MQIIVKRAQQINPLKIKTTTKKIGETEETCEVYPSWPFIMKLCPSTLVFLWKRLHCFALLLALGQVGFEGCLFLDARLSSIRTKL